jgi:large subunit ribosomal protein L6
MSRVGKSPVVVPKDVQVALADNVITIKGKLGELKFPLSREVKVVYQSAEENKETDGTARVLVEPANDSKLSRAMWGTVRSIINNMVKGVSDGFTIRLEINGVGYRAATDGKIITLALGYSHEIKYALPEGIKVVCEKPTLIVISGSDKQLVGQVAGELKKYRPVEPYKGKGIYKEGTKVRRKEGKKK